MDVASLKPFFTKPPKRYTPLIVAAILVGLMATANTLAGHRQYLVYNESASAPRGYYWLDHAVRDRTFTVGEWVVFGPPEPVRALMRERDYLRGATTLLKPIAALPGDRVCTENRRVTVNGVPFGEVRPTDNRGRPLPWYRHCAAVPAGHLFVLSRQKGSFDSRYFGPLPFGRVIARATPLWTS